MSIQFLFKGRLNRKHFLLATLFKITLFILWIIVTNELAKNFGWSDENMSQVIILDLFMFLIWIFGFSISLRRCYDLGWNKLGSILLSIFLGCPLIIGGVLLLFLGISKGSTGPNKYGNIDSGKLWVSIFGKNTN
jgi:uncharacterized membrane protein YhaH (DUF805 family)